MVIVKNLSVRIRNKLLLQNISCTLLPGRITTFVGKSGAGKTTVLKSLVNLVPIEQGSITINNQQLNQLSYRQKSENIGYVFQDFNLFPHLTVLQNCTDPLLVHEISPTEAQLRAVNILKTLEMNDFLDQYPIRLSGGQKQRVAIARALCLQPRVLLLDEPTASLDPVNTAILVTILQALTQQGLTIGVSSQDMNFVRKIFDRVYYIDTGKIVELCEDIQTIDQYPAIGAFMS